MAEESTNPETGVEVPTTEDSAVDWLSKRFAEESEGPPEAPKDTGRTNPKPEAQAEDGEGESEPGDEDVDSDPKAEDAKADDGDEVEFPDTLDGLAEANNVDPEELAGHLKVKVKQPDGSFAEVSIAELRDKHLLQADYTRKTQQLADKGRQMEAEFSQKSQEIQQRLQQADTLMAVLAQQIEQGPSDAEMNRLLQEDPAEYVRAKARKDAQEAAFRQAWQARTQREAEAKQQADRKKWEFRQQQQTKLLAWMPELKDSGKLSEFERNVADGLRHYGYSDENIGEFINGAFDVRQLQIIHDANKYRTGLKAGEQTRKKLVGKPKVTKPGAVESKGEVKTTKLEDARRRLRSPRTRVDRKASEAAGLEFVSQLLRG